MDVFETRKVVVQLYGMLDERDSIALNIIQKQRNKKPGVFTLIYLLSVLVISLIASAIWSISFMNINNNILEYIVGIPIFAFGFIMIAAPVWGIIWLIIFMLIRSHEKNRKLNSNEIATVTSAIAHLEKPIKNLSQRLLSSELPTKYHYPYAVNYIVDLFNCKRADNLKEAIKATPHNSEIE